MSRTILPSLDRHVYSDVMEVTGLITGRFIHSFAVNILGEGREEGDDRVNPSQ